MLSKLFLLICICLYFLSTSAFCRSENERDTSQSLETVFDPIISKAFEEVNVPGAIVGIWIGNEKSYSAALGDANIETHQSFTANDRVRIASVTKTFTATVILQLQDEGKLSLSDKLSKYLPEYPNAANITIEQIGNMTSGIFNYSEDEIFNEEFMKNIDKAFTPMQLINVAAKHPPYFPPGEGIYYSNTNFLILGVIVEILTGNKIEAEIKRRILEPLGMNETIFATSENFPDPHAHGYIYENDSAIIPHDITSLDPNWAWAAGAMISTLNDLYKYAKPLATGGLISRNSQEQRLKWGPDLYLRFGTWKDHVIKYGFGIEDFGDAYGHCGEIPGFNSFMAYIPDKDVTVIVLANMQENKTGLSPADYIGRSILDKIKTM